MSLLVGATTAHAQTLIAFEKPQQGYATTNGQFTVTVDLKSGAQPSTLHVTSGITDVTPQFNVSGCVQAPCTLSAKLTTVNGIIAGQNFLIASVLGSGGSAQTAHMQFNGTGFSDPTNGSAPGYIVSVQQTITTSSSTITIGTPTPVTIPSSSDTACTGNQVRIAVFNRSTLAQKSTNCYQDTAVATFLAGLDQSSIVFALSTPGGNTGAADFTAIGGSKAPTGGFSQYAAIGYGKASAGKAHEAWYDARQTGSATATVRGTLINTGCQSLYGLDSKGNTVPPTAVQACSTNQSASLYSFVEANNIGFAIIPGAAGSAGSPGLPTIYVGNPSNIPVGDSTTPTNQIRPVNSNTDGDLFSYKTYTPTWPGGDGEGGVYLLVLNSIDLSVISQKVYVTNCGSACNDNHASDNNIISSLSDALTNTASNSITPPNQLYLFTTMGIPFNAGSNLAPLLSAVSALGISPYALQAAAPDNLGTAPGQFSFVSYALEPASASLIADVQKEIVASLKTPDVAVKRWSSSANTQLGETGALRGVFVKGINSYYAPTDEHAFDVSDLPVFATGDDYLSHAASYSLGSTEPVAWPYMDTAGGRAAYSYLSMQLIDYNLFTGGDPNSTNQCANECDDIRFWYTGDQAANLYSPLAAAKVIYPGDSAATSIGFTKADFDNVQQQLDLEEVYLKEVLALKAYAVQMNTQIGQNVALALTQAGTNIALDMQDQLGFSQTETGDTPIRIAADTLNLLAGAGSAGIPIYKGGDPGSRAQWFKDLALPVGDGALWALSAIFDIVADAETNTTNTQPDPYVVQLQQLISSESNTATAAATNFNANLESATGTFYNGAFSDWFRLQSTALMSVNQGYGGWYVADTDQGSALGAQITSITAAQRVQLWQQVIPQYFTKAQYNNVATGWLVHNYPDYISNLGDAAKYFSDYYPLNVGNTTTNPTCGSGCDGVSVNPTDTVTAGWTARTSPGQPTVCQDITYLFEGSKFGKFWTSKIGTTLLGAPSSSNGLGNLNIDSTWLMDGWGIPWFAKSTEEYPMNYPQNVLNYQLGDTEINSYLSWACSSHTWPFSNQPWVVFSNLSVSPSTITQGATADVTISGDLTTSGSSKIPPGSVEITLADVTQSAKINAKDGSFSSTFAAQSFPGSPTPYAIAISYPGTANFAPGSDVSHTLTVLSPDSDVELSASPNPSYYGQAVTLSVSIKSPAGTPTGIVAFYDSSKSLGTQTLDSSGRAQLTPSQLSAGTHLITASYAGANGIVGNTSDLIYVQVSPLVTSLVVNNPVTQTTFGNTNVLISGQLAGKNASTVINYPPAGETVAITINGVALSTALTPNGNFQLNFPLTGLVATTYPVQIVYVGDNSFSELVDQSTSLKVGKATTTFGALTPSQTIQNGTENITLSGRLAMLGGVSPTGSVTVWINGVPGKPTPLTDGAFSLSFNTATLLASETAYYINYTYSGDSNYVETTDESTQLTVLSKPVATTFRNLTASQAINYGQPSVGLSGTISTPAEYGAVLTKSTTQGTYFNFFGVDPTNPATQALTSHATFSVWINTTQKSKQIISITADTFTNQDNAGSSGKMFLYMQGDQIGVQWEGEEPWTSDNWLSTDQTSISDGQWHHIAIVFGSDSANGLWNARLYKDGVSTGEVFPQHLVWLNSDHFLGRNLEDTSFLPFDGALWNAKIWNEALATPDLTTDMFQSYQSPTPTGLLLETGFDAVNQLASNTANTFRYGKVNGQIVISQLPAQAPPPGEKVQITIGTNPQMASIGLLGSFKLDYPTAQIAPGNYPVQYHYSGDANFSAAGDASTVLEVQPTVTTTNLTTSGSSTSTTYGTPLTFTATVSADNVVPTGTVTFYDGSTAIGPSELITTGVATFSTASLAVGNHSIMAVYPGAKQYAPSLSAAVPVTIKALTPTFSNLTSTTIGYGTPTLTLSGTVSAGSVVPSGSITISVSGPGAAQASAQIQLDGSFSGILDTSKLPIGTYQVTYSYTASGNFGDGVNNGTELIVGLASSNTTLTSSAGSVPYETGVTFTATVTSTAASLDGTVTFMEGATPLATPVILSGNTASLTISTLMPGPHSITASYSGNTAAGGSPSNAVIVTVVPLTTLLYSGASPAPVSYGNASVYLSGQIAGKSGETVIDYPTGQPLTITVGNISQTVTMQSYSTFGTYFPIMNLPVGTYPIKLDYTGNAQFSSMSDTSLQLMIDKATPVFTHLIAKPTIPALAQTMDLSGVISAQPQTSAILQFTQSNNSGVGGVVLPYDQTAVSTDSATYSVWIKTSTKTQQMLFQVSYEHPYIYMQNDQLGILWEGAGDGWLSADTTPISDGRWHHITITFNQGKIIFYKDGIATNDNFSVANSYHADNSLNLGGSYDHIPSFVGEMWNAKLWSKPLSASDVQDDMFAVYGGSLPDGLKLMSSLDVSSTRITNVVNGATAVAPNDPTTDPQIVADVLPVPTPAVAEPVVVSVNGQDTPLWVGTNGSFAGTVDISALTTGTYPITYTFGGDSNFVPTTDKTTSVTVQYGATTTSLASSANPASFTSNVTFTASVIPKEGIGSPTGSVTFLDGSTQIGSPVAITAGQAQLTVNSLAVGAHSITAVYNGDTAFASSTSNVLSQSISGLKPIFVALTPSQTISAGTPSVILGGQILAGTYIPSGIVSITLNGSTTPATINSDGTFSAPVETQALGFASYAVTYSFAASGTFKSASDSNTRITVGGGNTSITLASSNTIASYGQFITFTATVNNPSTATGSVTFYDNGNPVGVPITLTAGEAMWQTGSLLVGSHSMTAVYASDSPYYTGSTSPALMQTVVALGTVFSNLTPSQSANADANITLAGTISTPSSSGSVLQYLTATSVFGSGVLLQNDATGVSSDGATYSMWIKTTSKTEQIVFQVPNFHPIISMTGDQLNVWWDDSNHIMHSADTRPISDGYWHHIAVIFNKGVLTLYKDGIATSDSFNVPTGESSDSNTNLGGSISNCAGFLGQMWNVKVWAGALSDADIAADMNQTYIDGIVPTNLRLLASFDANAGTAINSVNGKAETIDSTTLASLASATLPAYYPAVNEAVSIAIGPQSEIVNIGQLGSFTSVFPLGTLAAGSYPIQYSYKGNAYLNSQTDKSTSLTLQATTKTTVSTSAPSSDYGAYVTFTAAVTSDNGNPTGSVIFYDGAIQIGSSVPLTSGKAISQNNTLSAGSHSITTVYTSDVPVFTASTSDPINQTINALTPVFNNLASPSITVGITPTVLDGSITAGTAFPAGATVTVKLNGMQKTPSIGNDGSFSASFDTGGLAAGNYNISYSFTAAGNLKGIVENSNSLTVVPLGPVTPNVTMYATPNPAKKGQTITLVAVVQQVGSVIPDGNITFSETFDENQQPLPNGPIIYNAIGAALDSTGTASFEVDISSNPTFTAGKHYLFATYGGDNEGGTYYLGSHNAVAYLLTVNDDSLGGTQQPVAITIASGTSASATVTQGGFASFPLAITAASSSGYTGAVALTCNPTVAVANLTCSVSPSLVSLANGTQTAMIAVSTMSQTMPDAKATNKPSSPMKAWLFGGLALIFLPFALRRRRVAPLLLLFAVASFGLDGCGGHAGKADLQYAAPGTYKFTISAVTTSGTAFTTTVSATVVVNSK